jgi:hypothetical protein
VPDVADLRLLTEIINHGAIGLPQAAWNAGMSQAEAAARLVTLAERGMPLRLVAEGDRQQLWHIAQAGPVTPAPPVFAPPPTAAPSQPDLSAPATGPLSTVPPNPNPNPDVNPDPTPDTGPASVWGVPGSSDWVRPADDRVGDSVDTADPTDSADIGEQVDTGPVPDNDPADGAEPAAAPPTRRVLTSGQPVQPVVGLFGEQLDVGLQQILDPADAILTAVGYRIDEGERALLVQTSIGNRGPVAYESLGDLYLEVVDAHGAVLPKAAMAVAGYPAHTVGVPANTLASGWTVFLVPADTEVAQLRWSVRPDLPDRTVSWGFGPAPTDPAN